jgi:hypothetical protein
MENKQKINAKKFVADVRAGKTDVELMHLHDLNPKMLAKVFSVLLQKQVLTQSELDLRSSPADPEPGPQPLHEPSHSEKFDTSGNAKTGQSFCAQCGAQVSKNMLTCPECGHALAGEERWEKAEPVRGILDRLSPKTIGCILAIPVAIALYLFFTHIIIPMADVTGKKRADAVRHELPRGKTPMEAAKDMRRELQNHTINAEVSRFVGEEVLSGVKADYSTFTVGPRWDGLSLEDKQICIQELSLALEGSGLPKSFRLANRAGQTLAKVVNGSVIWDERSGVSVPFVPPAPREEVAPDIERSIEPNQMERALQGLPGGRDIMRNLPR